METLYAKPDLSLRLYLFAQHRRPNRVRIQMIEIPWQLGEHQE